VILARNLLLGGAERVVVHYANHLRSVRTTLVLQKREGSLLSDVAPGVPVLDLETSSGAAEAASDRSLQAASATPGATGLAPASIITLGREVLRLRRVLERTGASLVSSFLMRSHVIGLLTKVLFRPDLRLILNVHEHMSESAHHLYPRMLDRALMRFVTRYLFPRADLIVVVAEGIRDDLVRSFGLLRTPIEVVRNPIDLQTIRRRGGEEVEAWVRPDNGMPLLVAVGRLVPLKGYDILLRAMQGLPARLGARLVIIGDGPERPRLEALAADLRLGEGVRFVGEQENPWKYVARATAFVHPSLTEAFPNVIGEALALGVPVVAADCSAGVREYLQDGGCGVLVPPGDETALAAAIERVLSSPALREQMATRGRARMLALGLQQGVDRYEQLIERVLHARAVARSQA
jgi:glycosyltransferase involved in cell wall biosynthesis